MNAPFPNPISSADETKTARLTITSVLANKMAFAISDDGESVFIPSKVGAALRLQPCDVIEGQIRLNTVRPDRTPWFCFAAVPVACERLITRSQVEDLLKSGGVWTGEEVAGVLLDSSERAVVTAAMAILVQIYNDGLCARFTLFLGPKQGSSRNWFTMFPDDADVDEWEEN